ncbi:MAG TPA: prepilin peptidase [Terriglobales bacterium]|nr:prepilin peptidase [Terriglobales bacterium]
MDLIFECALFILGLVFGSFLNVCISRIPRDLSIITPGSQCPTCGASIRWHDNIPVLSWVLLRGRCRDCRDRVSLRYPAVELLTATLFTACYVWFGPTWLTVKFCIFSFLLVGLLFMDAETGLLPREFTYPGIVLGLAFSLIAPAASSGTQFFLHAYGAHLSTAQVSLVDSAIGALAGAGFFFAASGLYLLIRKRQGMGTGDFALIAMSGAFLGLTLTLLVIFLAPVIATVYALIRMARHGSHAGNAKTSLGEMLQSWEVPFGVFISASSLAAVFFGGAVWQWYLSFF